MNKKLIVDNSPRGGLVKGWKHLGRKKTWNKGWFRSTVFYILAAHDCFDLRTIK